MEKDERRTRKIVGYWSHSILAKAYCLDCWGGCDPAGFDEVREGDALGVEDSIRDLYDCYKCGKAMAR